MSTWTVKQGDYHRQLTLDLTGISTTGATGVTFRMRPRGGGALVVETAGTIESASQVSYQFVAPQLATAGVFQLEAMLTYDDGTETVPTESYVTVEVLARLS